MGEVNQPSTHGTAYKGVSKKTVVTQCGKMVSGAYSRDSYADPDSFVLQVGMILERYNENVIRDVTNPINPNSIQRKHPKFPPTVGEIAACCEAEAERQFNLAKAAHQPRVIVNRAYVPPPNFPGCRANVFVSAEAPQYATMLDWSRRPDTDEQDWKLDDTGRAGIWVSLTAFQRFGSSLRPRTNWKSPSDDDLRESLNRLARGDAKPAEEIFPEGR